MNAARTRTIALVGFGLCGLLLALGAPALASDWTPRGSWSGRARLSSGYFSSQSVRPLSGALLRGQAQVTPKLKLGFVELLAPLSLEQRSVVGQRLEQTRAQADVQLKLAPLRWLKIKLQGGGRLVWRPAWPDPYQPDGEGELLPTDRYSHADWQVRAQLKVKPLAHNHARLSYGFVRVDSFNDPAFDPIGRPNHLTPSDRQEHSLRFRWRYVRSRWSLGVRARAFYREYFFLFARDAGTGKTHAGPGGPPPNPLQVLRGVSPGLSASVKLFARHLRLGVSYDYAVVDDVHAGYYSSGAHRPQVDLRWQIKKPQRLRLDLGIGAELRRYASTAYQAGPAHPALSYDSRRVDNRLRARLATSWRVKKGIWIFASGKQLVRRSNYPSYRPGIFPSRAAYNIDFSYNETRLEFGVELRR